MADLLAKRYKVIADFPGNRFKLNSIFVCKNGVCESDDNEVTLESNLKEFQHLFRELAWYEDRKPEEMPEYIKYKVISKGVGGRWVVSHSKGDDFVLESWHKSGNLELLPATEAEYIEYQKNK